MLDSIRFANTSFALASSCSYADELSVTFPLDSFDACFTTTVARFAIADGLFPAPLARILDPTGDLLQDGLVEEFVQSFAAYLTAIHLDVTPCRDESHRELTAVDIGGFAERAKYEVPLGLVVPMLPSRRSVWLRTCRYTWHAVKEGVIDTSTGSKTAGSRLRWARAISLDFWSVIEKCPQLDVNRWMADICSIEDQSILHGER
jgi:hypothetical protein